jgi:hypothetical protein
MDIGTTSVFRLLASQLGILGVILCRGEFYRFRTSDHVQVFSGGITYSGSRYVICCTAIDSQAKRVCLESFPRDAFFDSAIRIQARGTSGTWIDGHL